MKSTKITAHKYLIGWQGDGRCVVSCEAWLKHGVWRCYRVQWLAEVDRSSSRPARIQSLVHSLSLMCELRLVAKPLWICFLACLMEHHFLPKVIMKSKWDFRCETPSTVRGTHCILHKCCFSSSLPSAFHLCSLEGNFRFRGGKVPYRAGYKPLCPFRWLVITMESG